MSWAGLVIRLGLMLGDFKLGLGKLGLVFGMLLRSKDIGHLRDFVLERRTKWDLRRCWYEGRDYSEEGAVSHFVWVWVSLGYDVLEILCWRSIINTEVWLLTIHFHSFGLFSRLIFIPALCDNTIITSILQSRKKSTERLHNLNKVTQSVSGVAMI